MMADSGEADTSSSPSQLLSPTEEIPETADIEAETKVKDKVGVLLRAVGDAPILKQKLWKVDPDKQVSAVVHFIRKCIKLPPTESLFVYVSQAFSPAPDQTIGNLIECFGSDDRLVLHYCRTQAWG